VGTCSPLAQQLLGVCSADRTERPWAIETKRAGCSTTFPCSPGAGCPDGSKDFFNHRWHEYTGLSPVILTDGDVFSIDEAWLTRNTDAKDTGVGEREQIEAALAATKGRVSGPHGAATMLGIPRQTLESRIRALRINKHQFKSF